MSYSEGGRGAQSFTNVFVAPAAYDYFAANGKWPDKTTFVLEIYGSTSRGSINQHGSYQTDFEGLDVEVKDEARFADKWAHFNFDAMGKTDSAATTRQNNRRKYPDPNHAPHPSSAQSYLY